MLGAIAGDVIGSVHEWTATKTKDFPLITPNSRPTDDSVLTIAVADALLDGGDYIGKFHEYFHAYPRAGYGGSFLQWARRRDREAYHSFGNGSAMRVSPVAYARGELDEVLAEARRSAEVTHSHPEGIKGAQAVAAAIYLARQGHTKAHIADYVSTTFRYDVGRRLDDIRPGYMFDVTCQGSVPEAIIAFLESDSYEDAVRNAISLGGDADTMACIAGAIAEPFYGGVPPAIARDALALLPPPLASVVEQFTRRFCG